MSLRFISDLLMGEEGFSFLVTFFIFTTDACTFNSADSTLLQTLAVQLEALRLFATAGLDLFMDVVPFSGCFWQSLQRLGRFQL